jgi:hypothetical protein
MDIKHFAILEWVERDLLILKTISTSDNAADGFTKSLTKQLFYCHFDTYMGRRVLSYVHKRGNREQVSPRQCTHDRTIPLDLLDEKN